LAVLLDLNSEKALLEKVGSILDRITFLRQDFDALVCNSIREKKAFVFIIGCSKGSKELLLLKFGRFRSNEPQGRHILGLLHLFFIHVDV
jgi:hypothetical protein